MSALLRGKFGCFSPSLIDLSFSRENEAGAFDISSNCSFVSSDTGTFWPISAFRANEQFSSSSLTQLRIFLVAFRNQNWEILMVFAC